MTAFVPSTKSLRPMASSRGRTHSTASPGPAATTTTCADSAAGGRPKTGAETKLWLRWAWCSARCWASFTLMVLSEMCKPEAGWQAGQDAVLAEAAFGQGMVVGEHGQHHAVGARLCNRSCDAGVIGNQLLRPLRGSIVDHQFVPGLQQVAAIG